MTVQSFIKADRYRGFSILELIAAIAILAILTSLALPIYQQHAQKVRRLDGQNKLIEIMHRQQSFFANNLRYSEQLDDELGLAVKNGGIYSDSGFYTITAKVCENNLNVCVRLEAVPLNEEQETLTLDSLGRRTPDSVWQK